jgi:signal transduction histidine kinase
MFTLLVFITSFSALTMLLAGGLSLLRNPSRREHQWFFALTLCLAVWVPSNFFDSNVVKANITLPLVKVDFSFALIMIWLLLQFVVALVQSSSFSSERKRVYLAEKNSFRVLTTVLNLLLIIMILTNQLFQASISQGKLVLTTPHMFLIYVITLIFYACYALLVLGKVYLQSPPSRRQGLDLIWIGFFLAVSANIATNLIFPSFITNHALVKELNIVGYLGILFLVGAVYLAITSRKLFDIRLVVARSLAYVLLVIFVGAVYAGLITFVSVLVSGSHMSALLILTSTILTFIAAVSFEYIRHFFTRVTNHIFFRQNYDSQVVLNDLSNITTSTLDLDMLIKKTTLLLEQNLKSSFCVFTLLNNERQPRFFNSLRTPIVDHLKVFNSDIQAALKPHIPLTTDQLDSQVGFKKSLHDLQVELIIPLYVNKNLKGYMVFGSKQSGVVYSQQDIQLLTIAADSLALAAQNALQFEEIENFNLTLQQRVDEATRKLRRTNEKLKELDETKDDFISMASHQLRTPLTSVKGYLSMILEEDAGKITHMQREMLGQAFFSSQRMVYLIADLLNVSRLKTGKFIIEPTSVNLADMVQQELEQLEETAAAHQLTLQYDKPAEFPALMLDETKTRQVVMNFIDNAIYYTPAGGRIVVRLVNNPHSIELRVEDNGIGVPKTEQHHLFTKFYRAGNARKARPDGTGLGLFMAKKVVLAEGGSIIFNSAENKGSTFGFVFSKTKLGVSATTSPAAPALAKRP